jgi:hypothetical protein
MLRYVLRYIGLDLNHGRFGLDLHLGGRRGDLELRPDVKILSHQNRDAAAFVLRKTSGVNGDLIAGAGNQSGCVENASGSCRELAVYGKTRIVDQDLRICDRGPTRVGYHSGQAAHAASRLGERRRTAQQREHS